LADFGSAIGGLFVSIYTDVSHCAKMAKNIFKAINL